MRTTLTISRQWHQPQIQTTISSESISLAVDLADFCEALAREIGPVTWVFRDVTFRAKFDAAVERVLSGIKEESAKAV